VESASVNEGLLLPGRRPSIASTHARELEEPLPSPLPSSQLTEWELHLRRLSCGTVEHQSVKGPPCSHHDGAVSYAARRPSTWPCSQASSREAWGQRGPRNGGVAHAWNSGAVAVQEISRPFRLSVLLCLALGDRSRSAGAIWQRTREGRDRPTEPAGQTARATISTCSWRRARSFSTRSGILDSWLARRTGRSGSYITSASTFHEDATHTRSSSTTGEKRRRSATRVGSRAATPKRRRLQRDRSALLLAI
jgi:hypothetical protein